MNDKRIAFIVSGTPIYIEEELIFFDVPIMASCIDDNNQRYIALFIDDEPDCLYMVVKADSRRIIDMLEGRITMRDAFLNVPEDKVWYVKSGSNPDEDDDVTLCKASEIDEKYLPKSGGRYKSSRVAITEYVEKLKNEHTRIIKLCAIERWELKNIADSNIAQNAGYSFFNYRDKYILNFKQGRIHECQVSFN